MADTDDEKKAQEDAKKFAESQTKKNLEAAFAGESQAHTKYEYFASQAKKDGYEQIAEIFSETSLNEREHAKMWFKYLHGGKVPSTLENLDEAANGEHGEWTEMYPEFAKVADEEGYKQIAAKFRMVAAIEHHHEDRYRELVDRIDRGEVFERDGVKIWKCRNCGHLHLGPSAPKVCPVCNHPQSYFEEQKINY